MASHRHDSRPGTPPGPSLSHPNGKLPTRLPAQHSPDPSTSTTKRSPNIWDTPDTYEIENRAFDRGCSIEAAISRLRPLAGADLLDVGCGAGFHLPRFAERGARVVGIEPHLSLVGRARDRVAGQATLATVLAGSAAALPLAAQSFDVVHARWAYFFGAGSEPGLAEVGRVLRPGGVFVVVDNDATRSTFGSWFRRAYPAYDPDGVARFWRRHGFQRLGLDLAWEFDSRKDLESVTRIELPPAAADRVLAEHEGTRVDYSVNLWWRRAPSP